MLAKASVRRRRGLPGGSAGLGDVRLARLIEGINEILAELTGTDRSVWDDSIRAR